MIHISGKVYELIYENKNGWNPDAFRERYSEVLDRYDYIVGDWGYSQLRLKGFLKDNHAKATKDSSFSSLSDYINEYCNFGCAYFVLEKVGVSRLDDDETDPSLNGTAAMDDSSKLSERIAAEGDEEAGKLTAPDRYERYSRYDRSEGNERPDRKELSDKTDKSDKQDKPAKPMKAEKPDRQYERFEKPDRAERIDRPNKAERHEKTDRSERQNRPAHRDRNKSKPHPGQENAGEGKPAGGQHRKNHRSGNHHRKKPVGITTAAKDDVAAASEDNRKPRRDNGRL